MSLIDKLKDQMKQALVAKEKVRLGTIRMALAAIKQIEVDTRETLNDEQIIAVLTKMVKQRRDAIAQYEAAGRPELAEAEAAEIQVIETFLPQPLSESEIAALIDAAIQDSGYGQSNGSVEIQSSGSCRHGCHQCPDPCQTAISGFPRMNKPCFCAACLFTSVKGA
ncbi:MAG: hypothetical protein Sw2LagTSB_23910 [Shewanella algae]